MKPQLTLEAFAEFCERKPAREVFDLNSVSRCALGQFAKSIGFPCGSNPDFTIDAGGGRDIAINGITVEVMVSGKRTFGALARRLRAAQVRLGDN